jgi:hypothetical protein
MPLQFIGSCIVPFGFLVPVPSFLFPALSDLARRCSSGRPVPRVSDRTGDEASSCPDSSVFSAVPADGSSSRPDSRILQLGYPQIARLPRLSTSCLAVDERPGCPDRSIIWLYRRRRSRVAPNLTSFGGTVSNSPSRPGSSLLQPLPLMVLRVAPGAPSSGFAGGDSSGCPEALIPRLCRLVALRVSPNLPPSDICRFRSSGLPQIGFLGGSMMNPRFARTLHPRSIQLTFLQVAPKLPLPAAPRMNLQTHSGLAFLPTLRCSLNLYPLFACRRTGLLRTTINQFPIACRAGLQSVSLQGHQLLRE